MIATFALLAGAILRLFQSRRMLLLENLALRQQLAVLKRRHPRPRLDLFDKLFWVAVRRFWSGWQQSLIAVTPESFYRLALNLELMQHRRPIDCSRIRTRHHTDRPMHDRFAPV